MTNISIIIPTFGRNESVVSRTLNSILELDEIKQNKYNFQIFLIDQNYPRLNLNKFKGLELFYPANNHLPPKSKLVQIYGIPPSVTKAKNLALNYASGDYLIFFDDDIEVHNNCIENYINILSANSSIGFLGGREIIPDIKARRKKWKDIALNFVQSTLIKNEFEYKEYKQYIGRVLPNSFMFWNFNIESDRLIKIDSARGCNWATSKIALGQLRFDENFKGSAIREETDLYLRILQNGKSGYYTGKSIVTHHRQLGGCGNLLSNISSYISKLENEAYFQSKHFPKISTFFFFIRMLPLALEHFKISNGSSLLLLIKFTLNLK